jgi:predicted secreted protein
MMLRQPITVYFGTKSETDVDKTVANGDYDNWSVADGGYTGQAFITSLSANAANGENATYSLTLTGSGKLVKAVKEEEGNE